MLVDRRSPVLLVEDVGMEAKLLARALGDFGYSELTVCGDAKQALAAIEGGVRLVISDLELGATSGIELTRHIRAREAGTYTYVILLTGHGFSRLPEAFEAGVDDFISKPVQPGELLARLRAAERVLALEASLRARARELETALRRLDVTAARHALERAAAAVRPQPPMDRSNPLRSLGAAHEWTVAEEIIAPTLGEFLAAEVEVDERDDVPRKGAFAAEIVLSEPALEIELTATVVSEQETLLRLASHVLGERDLDGGQALLLEAANVMMGVLKTRFAPGGFAFTGGLPCQVDVAAAAVAFDAQPVRRRIRLRSAFGALDVWLRASQNRNVKVLARDLREGMVVSADVRDARGMLLIRAGSRLTQTAAERLAHLAPELLIAVSSPARGRAAA